MSAAPKSADRSGATPRAKKGRIRNLIFGILFFILGVIGILIPVMPQVLFFVISLMFFSMVFPAVRRRVRRFLDKHPRLAQAYKKWRDRGRAKRQQLIRRRRAFARKLHARHDS